ncbi:hypothetical protein Tco_1426154, partial [Tanacetum coccineum]
DLDTFIAHVISPASSKVVAAFAERREEKISIRYELSLVAGIATGAMVKGGSWSEVPAQVEGAAYRIDQEEVFVVWFFWKEQEGSIMFGLPGSRQQKFLVLTFFDVKEQQGIDRINKGSENKSKTCRGCKVELQGAQGDREAEGFQVSNDDIVVAQRRLENKQPEKKTNTDCLVKQHDKEYQIGWKIKTVWPVYGFLGRGYN